VGKNEKIVKVALLIETSRGYGREVLRGVQQYARLHAPWSFYLTPGDYAQEVPKMQQWGGMGIIARIETQKTAEAIAATCLPAIILDMEPKYKDVGFNFSEIHPDAEAISRMAADHFLIKGFNKFAFCGVPSRIWSVQREENFVRYLENSGFDCHVYQPPKTKSHQKWSWEQNFLADWLTSLPKPIGLMGCNDVRARQVLEACRIAGIQVPDEIAVLGVDNDELFCELSDPPLSSIAVNSQKAGYESAKLLDRLMRGQIRKPQELFVEPTHIAERQSTDVFAMEDREVASALRFIRQNSGQAIGVQEVLQQVALSRRALEMRFRRAMGWSIHAEIQRVRLDRIKQLLFDSGLPIPRIAELSGFSSPSYMAAIFRRETGQTPLKYRKQIRNQ